MPTNARKNKAIRFFVCLALCCALLLPLYGCNFKLLMETVNPPDRSASALVLTDRAELDLEELKLYEFLRTLDLRALDVTLAEIGGISAALPNCRLLWRVKIAGETFDSSLPALTLPAGTTDEEFAYIRFFDALTSVDASACELTIKKLETADAYPNVSFVWNAEGVPLTKSDTTLDLTGRTIENASALTALLNRTPALESVDLTNAVLPDEALFALIDACQGVDFIRTFDVFGAQTPFQTTELDLSKSEVSSADALIAALKPLVNLTSVDVTGHTFTDAEIAAVRSAYPNVAFSFSLTRFGQTITTQTTELDLRGNTFASPEEVASQISDLTALTKVDLCDTGLTNEQMEVLIAQFPNVKFVWKVRIGAWVVRTDITAFSKGQRKKFPNGMGECTDTGKTNFHSEDLEPLKYCTDLVYLDLGHGNRITDLSILSYLPKLKILIVSMNKIEDLSPVAQCKELELLEIYQNRIVDLSPINELPKLRYLNCSANSFTDITPILQCANLEMLWVVNTRQVTKEMRAQLKETLPNCVMCFSANSSGEGGWIQNGLYAEYQTAFGLPIREE